MQPNKITVLLVCLLPALAISALAGDLNRGYEKMLNESRSYQEQFRSRARRLCAEIKANCERSALVPGRTISLVRPVQLHIRSGYRITKASITLPAHTPFTLQGTLKGYYKIATLDGKKYLLLIRDFRFLYTSGCQPAYERCLAGRQ